MSENTEIPKKLLELIKTKSPATVEKLIEIADQELDLPRDIALKHIIDLENQGRLSLSSLQEPIPKELSAYLVSTHAVWFWIILFLSISTTVSVFTIPEKAVPYVYIRYVLGSVSIFLLPGFSLIKTFFPTREINNIERIALSMGMSLVLVPLVGLLLNYTPWGIKLTPITLSLLSLTILLTITGIIREHNEKTRHLNE